MGDLAAALARADRKKLEEAMQAGLFDEQMGLMNDQMARAQALRGARMPQGRMIGDVYVAPNMGENIGAMLQQIAGMRDQNRIQGQQEELLRQMPGRRISGLELMAGAPDEPGPWSGGYVPFGYGGQ